VFFVVSFLLSFTSCAIHQGLTGNLNTSATNVILQSNNYKIVQKVKGNANGLWVLGFGGSFSPMVERARSEMLEKADLIGASRAIINETVEINHKFFLLFGIKTVTVSAYVIEFTDANVNYERRDIERRDLPDANNNVRRETVNNDNVKDYIVDKNLSQDGISGRWISEKGDIQIIIDENVGVFSQIKSGNWLTLMKNGEIKIGDLKFKDITKTGDFSWKCKELINDYSSPGWQNSNLTLDETGKVLTVIGSWGTPYNFSRVK